MTKVEVKNLAGKKVEDLNLNSNVFGVEANDELLHEVFVIQYGNRRQGTSHTKTRGERAGSTRKPWKQKGTGRARTGSVRNSIWRKGGVTFGPSKERNWKKKINKKVGALALKMALSGKVKSSELIVVDSLKLAENKTRLMKEALDALKIDKKALIAFSKSEAEFKRATNNLENCENTSVKNLNVFDILNRKYLVLNKEGVKYLEEKYGKKEAKKESSSASDSVKAMKDKKASKDKAKKKTTKKAVKKTTKK